MKRGAKSTKKRPPLATQEEQVESNNNDFDITIMRKIFQAAQFVQKQNKCVQSMFKLIKEVDFEEFYEEFCRDVKATLAHEFENPKVKNILDMIATFTISIKNENILKNKLSEETFDEIGMNLFGKSTFLDAAISTTYKNLLDYILKDALIPFLNSSNVSTRLNTLYLICKILEHCADIEINIYNRLKASLIDRIRDRNVNVRLSATRTLHRFQSIDEPDDQVVCALKFHLKHDPANSVRLACLKSIFLTKFVLPDIISKTRDISSKIRDLAFDKIAKRVNFKTLTTEQRLTVMNNGINDRNEKVNLTVRNMLVPAWIKSYNDDIIELLNDLDVIVNVEVISKFLNMVFQYAFSIKLDKRTRLHLIIDKFYEEYLDDRSLLTKKQLSAENCLFWRSLSAFLKKNEEEVMKYQPDLEKKLIMKKEINSLLEAIDDLDVPDVTIQQLSHTNLNRTNELDGTLITGDIVSTSKNGSLSDKPHSSSATANESRLEQQSSMINDERSLIEKELEEENDSMRHANPVDLIIPSLSNFVKFFREFCQEINENDSEQSDAIDSEFIFKEMCQFLNNYEIADDSQKNLVVELVDQIIMMNSLGNKFDEYIEHLIRYLSKSVLKTNEELTDYTVNITNKVEDSLEIRDSEEELPVIDPKEIRKLELALARETVCLHDLKDKLDEALVRREYNTAHDYKQQIEVVENKMGDIKHEIDKMNNISIRQHAEPEIEIDIKDHPSVHLKLLQIFGAFLRYGKFRCLNAMMDTRINKYILPGILSTDSKIRYDALKALNHACFLSSSLSARYCALYHEICTKDCEHIQVAALQGIIDALIEHGLYILYPDDEPAMGNETGEQSILNTPGPFEQSVELDKRKKSNANSIFTNTREFTKESSFLLNKSEITSPNISFTDDEDADAEQNLNKLHHNTNNESDLDRDEHESDEDEMNETQANLTVKSAILDRNTTLNKTQAQMEKEEEIIKQLTKFLLKFIRSNKDELKATSVHGICKLLLLGKLYSPLLLSELILLWYNSSTSQSIQHDIGTFLPIYCQASAMYNIEIPENFNGQHCLLECFLSTVENVYRIERGEQLEISFDLMHSNYYDSDIDAQNVIDFMLNLLEIGNHAAVALEFCERILAILQIARDDEYELKEPFITKYLIKSLPSFKLFEATEEQMERLKFLTNEIMVTERYKQLKKLSMNKIVKFVQITFGQCD